MHRTIATAAGLLALAAVLAELRVRVVRGGLLLVEAASVEADRADVTGGLRRTRGSGAHGSLGRVAVPDQGPVASGKIRTGARSEPRGEEGER